MVQDKDFVHLHVHTGYSILDGHAMIGDLVNEVARLGQPGVAITDHGNMYGTVEFMRKAKDAGITPIIGLEAYVTPGGMHQSHKEPVFYDSRNYNRKITSEEGSQDVSGRGAYTHMTLLAHNTQGIYNLFKTSSLSFSEGFYRKPRTSVEVLAEKSEGLIATTGCPSGDIQTYLRVGRYDQAVAFASQMQDIFGKENYFVELMDHNMTKDLERGVRDDLLRLGKELNIPFIATNDVHYVRKEDARYHEAMLAMQTGKPLSEPADHEGGNRFAFEGSAYYVKSAAEMDLIFGDVPGALSNTVLIAERAQGAEIPVRDDLRPHVDIPAGETTEGYFRRLCLQGLKERSEEVNQNLLSEEYRERLEEEISVIVPKGYVDYFKTVADFTVWAKNNDVIVGPARGSAGGSLAAYALRITELDPIRHHLLFERFLNPERDSPPDIDLDFDDMNRSRVIQYITDTYGADKVGLITTYTTLKAKSALKDVAKILEKPYSLALQLTKSYPDDVRGKGMPLKDVYNPDSDRYAEAAEFRAFVEKEGLQGLVELAEGVEGRVRGTGVHAAGVIISSKPLQDTIPLATRQTDQATLTQYDYPTDESLGLLKVDILGLANLTIIHNAILNISRSKGVDVDMYELIRGEMNDPVTMQLLQRGDTLGVFQLDSMGMRTLLRRMRPDSFEDLSAIGALYRPGPMDANAHNDYADRKNGLKPIVPIHPELEEALEPVLGSSYGLCVPKGTLIYDDVEGLYVPIEDLKAGESHTFSLNEKTGAIELKQVNHLVHTGTKKIVKVALNGGREIRVSDTHPVLTDQGYVSAGELSKGSRVRMLPQHLERISTTNDDILTPDTGYFLGAMLGDGTMVDANQQYFTNSEEELLEVMSRISNDNFEGVFTSRTPRIRNGCHYTTMLTFHSGLEGEMRRGKTAPTNPIRTWFRELGYEGKVASEDKHLPEAVFQADREVLLNVVAGLWDTDGTTESGLHFTTISKQLWEDMQQALLLLGVDFGVNQTPYSNEKRKDQVAYRIFPVYADFYAKIRPALRSTRKRENARQFIGVQGNGIERHLPLAEEIFTLWAQENTNPKFMNTRMVNALKEQRKIGWIAASTYLNLAFKTDISNKTSFIKAIETLGIGSLDYSVKVNARYRTVTSVVADGYEECYDIEVADNHNFLVNGVVVHNCIYQEQVMKIAQVLAGYSLAQADNLRRAMGKKKKSVLDAEYVGFEKGMVDNGFSPESVKALWDIVVPFSDYAFNRSHSVAYAMISYVTAYLKANYTAEYMSALLTSAADDPEKIALYLQECKNIGIKVSPPDIARSLEDYSPVDDTEILVGLRAIRGIGSEVARKIIEYRSSTGGYGTLTEYLDNAPNTALNKSVIEGLILSGSFDSYGYTRRAMEQNLPEIAKSANFVNKKKDQGQGSMFDIIIDDAPIEKPAIEFTNIVEYPKKLKLAKERHMLGLYVSDHPLSGMERVLEENSNTKIVDIIAGQVSVLEGNDWGDDKHKVTVAGLITSIDRKTSKTGNEFAIIQIEDTSGTIDAPLFSTKYEKYKDMIFTDDLYKITGVARRREEDDPVSFSIDSMERIEAREDGKVPFYIRIAENQNVVELKRKAHQSMLRHKGESPIFIEVKSLKNEVTVIEVPETILVKPSAAFTAEIRSIFGINSIGRWEQD